MARDKDNLYGMQFRGNERSLQFVDPYRTIGELNTVEQQKLDGTPSRWSTPSSPATRWRGRGPSTPSLARWSG